MDGRNYRIVFGRKSGSKFSKCDGLSVDEGTFDVDGRVEGFLNSIFNRYKCKGYLYHASKLLDLQKSFRNAIGDGYNEGDYYQFKFDVKEKTTLKILNELEGCVEPVKKNDSSHPFHLYR